jgi:hypothetical protein
MQELTTNARRPKRLSVVVFASIAFCAFAMSAGAFAVPWLVLTHLCLAICAALAWHGIRCMRELLVLFYLAVITLLLWSIKDIIDFYDEMGEKLTLKDAIHWPIELSVLIFALTAVCWLFSARVRAFFQQGRSIGKPFRSVMLVSTGLLLLQSFMYFVVPRLHNWPVTLQEAAQRVIDRLSPTERHRMANATEEELVGYHFGLGMYIRNQYGLWGGNSRLRHNIGGNAHPDDQSFTVIKRARQILREQNDLREPIAR